MDRAEIRRVLDAIPDHVVDVRGSPTPGRRGQFKAGWRNHAARGRQYSERVLARLTWNNLGYRLAQAESAIFADDPDALDDLFDIAADGYHDGSLRLARRG